MRFEKMQLADPSHKLPMPAPHKRMFVDGENVPVESPFWAALVLDGSIVPYVPPAEPAAESTEPVAS